MYKSEDKLYKGEDKMYNCEDKIPTGNETFWIAYGFNYDKC
jgi:hypothetical protein